MYCNGCGQALGAGQHYCPRCGRTVAGTVAAQSWGRVPPGLPLGWIDRRIHTLAVAWLIYAAVIGIGGLGGLAFAHAAFGAGEGASIWGWHGFWHHGWGPRHMPFVFFWPFMAGAFFVRVGLALAAGYGLLQRTRWGRVVGIVAGCLALVHVPFGTALGLWTLFTLLSAPNALAYEMRAAR